MLSCARWFCHHFTLLPSPPIHTLLQLSPDGGAALLSLPAGALQSISDAHEITAIRTAAASAVATDVLSNPDSVQWLRHHVDPPFFDRVARVCQRRRHRAVPCGTCYAARSFALNGALSIALCPKWAPLQAVLAILGTSVQAVQVRIQPALCFRFWHRFNAIFFLLFPSFFLFFSSFFSLFFFPFL